MQPIGRCRIHGGKTPTGIALPQTKTGRYSKYLPQRLLTRYAESLQDPELLAVTEEIALADARLGDLIGRVETGESGSMWKLAKSTLQQFHQARKAQDTDGMAEALRDLDKFINRGVSDYAAWDEVGKVLDRRVKLVESERKRRVEAQQVLTLDRALLMVSALSDAVRRHVDDPSILQAISDDLRAVMLGTPAGGPANERGGDTTL